MQLHHHGAWFDAEKGQYTLFGGFGNMRYSKSFYAYDLNTHEWSVLDGFGGDSLCPRYFSSVGYSRSHDAVYIFGGMGNESGEQVVGRYYFYDLHRVDLATRRIRKLWELPWEGDNVVPVRSMVIPDPSAFYTLCYPEIYSDSYLRLYRFPSTTVPVRSWATRSRSVRTRSRPMPTSTMTLRFTASTLPCRSSTTISVRV